MKRKCRFRLASLSAMLICLPGRAPAQGGTAPKTLYACYLPQSGVVYRVAETDLRFQTPVCASQNHVLFSWNDKGEKGDKGDPGQAGNLALAGHICPAGQFVVGFSTSGALVCSALSGGSDGGGGTPPPTQYVGAWSLQPALRTHCSVPDYPLLSSTLAFTVIQTRLPAADQIVLDFEGTYYTLPVSARGFAMPFDGVSGSFAASTPFSLSYDNLIESGAISVNGTFVDFNSFTATVTFSIQGQLYTPASGWKAFTCDPLAATVAGTRM